MSDIEEPIVKGEIPFYVMDKVSAEDCKRWGLTADTGKAGQYPSYENKLRYYWLTKKLIIVVESTQSYGYKFNHSVRAVLQVNSLGTLDGLGVEGLLRPEAQDAIKSWMVLAKMQENKGAAKA